MEGVNGDGSLIKLICCVKNSDWGRIGRESTVARLYYRNTGIEIDLDQPYAEFWMGTHESGPSYVVQGEKVTLKDWIERNPRVLGDNVVKKWGTNLPFLFKVLSVAKALSIQAHPDKVLATSLHKEQPFVYKDDNHKPEMAFALTEFEALCGFVSLEELKVAVKTTPEIVEVIGNAKAEQILNLNEDDGEEEVRLVLQSAFTDIMSVRKDVIAEVLAKLISRLNIEDQARHLTDKEQLILRLEKQYPADVGVLAAYLLNYVKLNPGEALYLGSNEPHAYLYGESVECMANSDNVIRAGLTPKHRDVKILCSMLTYRQGFPEILKGTVVNPYTMRYLPPFDEFEVDRCILPQQSTTVFPSIPGPSIFLVMGGEGTMTTSSDKVVTEGDVLFASANTKITVATLSGLHLYRAGVSSRLF
ncbi:mannose-6-phosphate isomerase 2-like [Nicotiana tomentosiformis]|uniref:mannose-6-phosphate isomerase 2-like n=1 Tax=Nicotiana tomentosiformis TaxID=4098 RepID=UPI00051AD541|nr:mannose-6-phosphate isomerase 2-like [Nicotiana tomentosiformis]XP_009595070.1 mannose-6-phosphate isomerase 2-like [Nicotiana tomentosiformis]